MSLARDDLGNAAGGPPRRPRRRRLMTVLVILATVLIGIVTAAAGLLLDRQRAYDRNIERIPAAFPEEEGRPPPAPDLPDAAPGRAENWLLVGSDGRADQSTTRDGAAEPVWRFGTQRADTIMLVHLPADRSRLYLVSFPRDAWVPIEGYGTAKINAAFSYGGPPLLITTVEQLTGVRVDHFAVLDFAGFRSMTDALGGVEVRVAGTVTDPEREVVWQGGTHHLDGAQALDFVRQRYNLPGGDFDRIKRQQAFLKALAGQVVDSGTLANPLKLNAFLEATTKSISVDESLTVDRLRSLAMQFRSVRAGDIAFMTVPVAGTGNESGQSVVYLHQDESRRLYRAMRKDRLDKYVKSTNDALNEVDEVS